MIDTAKTIGTKSTYNPKEISSFLSEGVIRSIPNLERAILSLEYLGQLVEEGLDLIFKGGSAVQVILSSKRGIWTRLSVDADICVDLSREEFENVLERVFQKFDKEGFSYSQRAARISSEIPFYLYRIETPPITDLSRVFLLDAMGIKPEFSTVQTPLKTPFFDSQVEIVTPTVGALIGDKISTIGPTTIGRQLVDSRNGLEYAKHFHDINQLIKLDFSFKECAEAYYEAVAIQSRVRGRKFTPGECFDDLVFTCQVASLPPQVGDEIIEKKLQSRKEQRARAHSEFRILRRGLQRFLPFLVRGMSYAWDDIRFYAARTALLANMINNKMNGEKAMELLTSDFSTRKEDILRLIKQIESLSDEERWFIEKSEIKNFPKVLKTWHDFFFVEDLM